MIKEHYTIKDVAPLLTIFAFITIASVGWSVYAEADFMRWMQLFMGLFFVVFGAFKVLNLQGFKNAYLMYDLIAMRFPFYGYIYPFIELLLGAAYLMGVFIFYSNIVTLVLMSVSAWGVYLKLRKKEKIMCACLGVLFKVPMTWVTLTEDLLMALMAIVMLFI